MNKLIAFTVAVILIGGFAMALPGAIERSCQMDGGEMINGVCEKC